MSSSELPLVDLKAQYGSLRGEIDAAIREVLERQVFIGGPETTAFEAEFAEACEARTCVAVSSGTSALELTLEALGVGPGDEVITVAHTFFATAEAVVRRGAIPVFVDVSPEHWTMLPELVTSAIGPRTRALIPVHIYGHPADVPAIAALAPGVPIIEDAAQAHGARYHGLPLGSAATAACYSFFPAKNLGAYGDAGAVVTGDDDFAARIRALRDHGRSAKYEHESIGTNARISELQAAVLRVKLRHLPEWLHARRRLSLLYEERLGELDFQFQMVATWAEHARHLFVVRHPDRDALRVRLAEERIATGVHFPIPAHLQRALAGREWRAATALSETEELATSVLSLPLYPELAEEDLDRVAGALRRALAAAAPR